MSRYRSAVWKPIADRSTRAVQKDVCCWHTAVSTSLAGTWGYFNTGAGGRGVYSHGMIGGGWGADLRDGLDGVAWQMQDSDLRAAANYEGNPRIIAWETSDNAARPIQPWTTKQCNKIVEIMVETYYVNGIPLVLVPDSLPGRRGHAYHRLGCDPYRVAGGELWSTAYGKDCPTDPRIRQLPGLLDRARAIVAGGQEDWFDMATLTDDEKARLMRAVDQINGAVGYGQTSFSTTIEATLAKVNGLTNEVRALAGVTGDDEATILDALGQAESVLAAKIDATHPAPEPTT